MQQLSLFDILLVDDPAPTREILWSIHHRSKYETDVEQFKLEYGEDPVFRLQLLSKFLDIYYTHPRNAVAIDTRTGLLVQGDVVDRLVWGNNADYRWTLERPRNVSPQVLAVLLGTTRTNDWTPEIERVFHYPEGMRNDVIDLLLSKGLAYSFYKGGVMNYCQVFASPTRIDEFERAAAEAGLVVLIK